MPTLREIREDMAEMQRQMHIIFSEAGPDLDMDKVSFITGTSYEKVLEIRRREEELDKLGQERDRLENTERALKAQEAAYQRSKIVANGPPPGTGATWEEEQARRLKLARPGALRQMFREDKGYQAFRRNELRTTSLEIPLVDFKTLITLADINVPAQRLDPVAQALESRTISDLFLGGETEANTIEYPEETFTNAAAAVAEGVAKPESAITFAMKTVNVRKIAHWIPASKESLDDVAVLESWVRGRLAFGVIRKEEDQLLNGTGTSPQLRGVLNFTGLQTQAKGVDPTPDAVYKAMQLIRGSAGLGFAEPTAFIVHPSNWTPIKLLRTADGIYIWGNPSDEGPDRIWGLPVRQTTALAAGTGLVGAFRPHGEIFRREGISVSVSTEHASYFVENKVALLAEERLGLAIYRPSAFCTVTGLTA